jgi:hypothetical protein
VKPEIILGNSGSANRYPNNPYPKFLQPNCPLLHGRPRPTRQTLRLYGIWLAYSCTPAHGQHTTRSTAHRAHTPIGRRLHQIVIRQSSKFQPRGRPAAINASRAPTPRLHRLALAALAARARIAVCSAGDLAIPGRRVATTRSAATEPSRPRAHAILLGCSCQSAIEVRVTNLLIPNSLLSRQQSTSVTLTLIRPRRLAAGSTAVEHAYLIGRHDDTDRGIEQRMYFLASVT